MKREQLQPAPHRRAAAAASEPLSFTMKWNAASAGSGGAGGAGGTERGVADCLLITA